MLLLCRILMYKKHSLCTVKTDMKLLLFLQTLHFEITCCDITLQLTSSDDFYKIVIDSTRY